MKKYTSCKRYPELGAVAYRQWRADSHCNKIHGYAMSFEFHFEAETLDTRNWVVDFGGLKELENYLKQWFDHTLLVATDDPEIETFKLLQEKKLANVVEFTALGCEALASQLIDFVNDFYIPTHFGESESVRVKCVKVEVRETVKNWAYVTI